MSGVTSAEPWARDAVAQQLLGLAEQDQLPAGHVSSYWRQVGALNRVQRGRGRMVLEDRGIGDVRPCGPLGSALHAVERLSYRRVTRALPSYGPVWETAKRLARRLSYGLTYDVWRYAVGLAVLVEHWNRQGVTPRVVAVIGDGHGFFGALVRAWVQESRLYSVDLPKSLVFQLRTHRRADPSVRAAVLAGGWGDAQQHAQLVLALPPAIEAIPGPIDCAVSMASLQEMTPYSIQGYFRFLRRRSAPASHFYCVNRVRKDLPGGAINRFEDYPWRADDRVFLDGPCPYYTHFLTLGPVAGEPRVWGWRRPLIGRFEGRIVHRLAHLAPEAP
jgi:hypothetical protein